MWSSHSVTPCGLCPLSPIPSQYSISILTPTPTPHTYLTLIPAPHKHLTGAGLVLYLETIHHSFRLSSNFHRVLSPIPAAFPSLSRTLVKEFPDTAAEHETRVYHRRILNGSSHASDFEASGFGSKVSRMVNHCGSSYFSSHSLRFHYLSYSTIPGYTIGILVTMDIFTRACGKSGITIPDLLPTYTIYTRPGHVFEVVNFTLYSQFLSSVSQDLLYFSLFTPAFR